MAVRDKIAGKVVADRDKTARAEAIHDKIAGEVVELLAEQPIEATLDNTVDPSIEWAVPEAVDRVGEEANEIIVEEIIIIAQTMASSINANGSRQASTY